MLPVPLRCTLPTLLVALALVLVATGAHTAAAQQSSYSVGQSVQIEWNESWYPGRIVAAEGGRYKITYDGYGSSWDEWVTPARLRAAGVRAANPGDPAPASANQPRQAADGPAARGAGWAQFKAGDRAELDVVCSGDWSPVTILKIEVVAERPGKRDYYVRHANGHEWSFSAPGIVAPCSRRAGGIARDRAALPAPQLGVYTCNYRGQMQPVFDFALLTGSAYRDFDGGRGTYRYDTATRQLVFLTGPHHGARAQQVSAKTFQFLDEKGLETGNYCPHNPARDPNGRW